MKAFHQEAYQPQPPVPVLSHAGEGGEGNLRGTVIGSRVSSFITGRMCPASGHTYDYVPGSLKIRQWNFGVAFGRNPPPPAINPPFLDSGWLKILDSTLTPPPQVKFPASK